MTSDQASTRGELSKMGRTSEQIAKEYYATTAVRGHSAARVRYDSCASGLIRRLGPWMPASGARCLDLGCGCGELIYALERAGITTTTGVDLSQESLDSVRQLVTARLECDDVLLWLRRCPPESFDFISAFNFLEHLEKEVAAEFLREVRRVLAPGGCLVLMVPNAISPCGTLTRYWDYTHEWAFTPNNFRQLAALTGYSARIDFRECGPVPHGIVSSLRYTMWQAVRLGIALRFLIEVADLKGGIYTMDMMVRLHSPGPSETE